APPARSAGAQISVTPRGLAVSSNAVGVERRPGGAATAAPDDNAPTVDTVAAPVAAPDFPPPFEAAPRFAHPSPSPASPSVTAAPVQIARARTGVYPRREMRNT
ncbi:MAG TPA: hypothetical protein VFV94_19005, partial [Polyangiaceae bacterium]|nr:hypothetical protein [Polyangiaceae bacterium]